MVGAGSCKGRLGRWYLDLLLGVLLGARDRARLGAARGATSAARSTGSAIFWGQTAGRVSESFAHRAPWWYYLPLLPLILFPVVCVAPVLEGHLK